MNITFFISSHQGFTNTHFTGIKTDAHFWIVDLGMLVLSYQLQPQCEEF